MSGYKLFLKILLVTSLLFSSLRGGEVTDLIKRVISNIVKAIPQFKEELKNSQTGSFVVNKIVQSGFTSFKQRADLELYSGVNEDQLTDFLHYVRSMLSLPESYSKYFVENLSLILFSDFNEIVIFRVLFSVDAGGDCKYICVMGQKNENGTTDWLVGDVKAEFTLAPDVLVIKETKSAAWGLYKSEINKIVSVPKSLTEEQLTVLFKFFEICVFERFAELLKININQNLNFLE